MRHHVYQETIKIEENKSRRILELCKEKGIELYDLYANNWSKAARTNKQRTKKQEKTYFAQYIEWSEFTKNKLEKIFLTPRMYLEFVSKDSTKNGQVTEQIDIVTHIERGLVSQIYFLETIINEIDNYQLVSDIQLTTPPLKKAINRLFNIDHLLNMDLKGRE